MTRARDLGDFIADGAAPELVVDTTTLVVDSTNNRVGIGTATPSQALDVSGSAAISGTATIATVNASTALQIGGVAVTSTAAELNILDGVTATATELNYVDGVTSSIQTQLDAKAPLASPTFTTKATVDGTLDIEEVYEKVTVQTSTTGTITFDTTAQAVELYTANQTANRTINFSNVNSNLAIGQSITAAILMTQGSTAYYLNAYQIDGSSVTPKWQGGSAPTAGNASSIDSYSFTIIKTADATFTVLLSTFGAASAKGFGFGGAVAAPPGQAEFTSSGSHSWTAPDGVTSVSVVVVGAGGGVASNGGGLAYRNNISVTPGSSYSITVGAGGTKSSGYNDDTSATDSTAFSCTATAGKGGTTVGTPSGTYDGGGNGGRYGGGAGGYSGNGGQGATSSGASGTAGSGGAGGGASGASVGFPGGGGVGIYGEGASGAAGTAGGSSLATSAGRGGAGGENGSDGTATKGKFGGGGALDGAYRHGAGGAVRIIWPGDERQFPSTRTADE